MLDPSHHNGNGNPPTATGLASLDQLDHSALRESLLRRASVQHFPGGSLNFERFETENVDDCIQFIRHLIERSAELNNVSIEEMRKSVKIMATGGGAHRFYEMFGNELHVEVRREDEMECLIEGLKFFTLIPGEVYYFSDDLIHSVSHPNAKAQNGQDGVYERPSPDPPKYAITSAYDSCSNGGHVGRSLHSHPNSNSEVFSLFFGRMRIHIVQFPQLLGLGYRWS